MAKWQGPDRYNVETGLELVGEGIGGYTLGSTLAESFLGPTLGWGLGGALGVGSMALTLLNAHEAKKAYRQNKEAINISHRTNVANLRKMHRMQRQAISSGVKGIGGGHAVGTGRAGTVQKQARAQQTEIAGLERQSEAARYQAAMAQNRAARGGGGSQSALESMLGIGTQILGMLEPAKPLASMHVPNLPEYTGGRWERLPALDM